ncbi:cytochrome P450 [Daldinia decipiens]|uniref:cytochrome P450 n=1 Tax=Daldinia decipiens TaxID=326647 RepID=UPI0020C35877|nr:cytochrome P450 [Daldinia decipiens]KAI1653876.1 cytochrome P450 [Daldinia decipiens]
MIIMEYVTHKTSPFGVLLAVVLSPIIYFIFLIVYRLYFSPLARFPGPKLAAATSWYVFYYDYWLNGQFVFEIRRMHEVYGPIVRINPAELSIHDPKFYDKLYVVESRRRTESYDAFCKGIDHEGSFLLTKDHDLHRRRRKPFEPFFSRRGITLLQSMLSQVTLHFESRLREFEGGKQVIRLDHAFSAFSGDIIRRICLDVNDTEDRFLNDTAFSLEWYDMLQAIIRSIPLFTGFPWIIYIAKSLPERFLLWVFPRGQMFKKFSQEATQSIRRAMADISKEEEHITSVFHHVMKSDMPESDKSEERLTGEAQVMLGGGTVTTARTLSFASYYILSRPEVQYRLEHELKDIMADWPQRVPTWAELERLPFLQGVIKESLRLGYGVMHRLPRVSPDAPINYKEYMIPVGTPVSMSGYLMHSDPVVYPSPDEFIPQRWVGDDDKAVHRNFVPFCRGSRSCLGKNLAMAEMSLALAVLYRPGGLKFELFETDESDVKPVHDFMIPLPKLNTKGVRILIH